MSNLVSTSEQSYTSAPLSSSTTLFLRSDARPPLSYRDITLDTHVVEGTIGSAKVIIGETGMGGLYTEVWAGVRGEIEDMGKEDASTGVDGMGRGRIVVAVEW